MKKTITKEELAMLKDISERDFLTLTEEEQKSIKIITEKIERNKTEEQEREEVMEEINKLITEYQFPLAVLQDVEYRINSNNDPNYLKTQLRFLKNWVNSKKV